MRSDVTSMRAVVDGFPGHRIAGPAARRPGHPRDTTEDVVEPPPPPAAAHSLPTMLRERQSVKVYAPEAVPVSIPVAVSAAALERDRRTWGLDETSGALEVAVFTVRGEEPGAFLVTRDGVSRTATADGVGNLEELVIQKEFAQAPGIIAVLADLVAADEWGGDHGYRITMTRAAMAAYDIHTHLLRRGLVGSLFGGFISSAARRLVQGDDVTRRPLIALTYGYARGLASPEVP